MMQPRQYAQAVMAGEIGIEAVPAEFRQMVDYYVATTGARDRRLAESVLLLRTREQRIAALEGIADAETRERVRKLAKKIHSEGKQSSSY